MTTLSAPRSATRSSLDAAAPDPRRPDASVASPGPVASPSAAVAPIAVVAVPAKLDDAAAARLLRWCEARLYRRDVGATPLAHLLLDFGHTHRAAASALGVLDHARVEAERRQVGIHLVGVGSLLAGSLQARRHLGRWSGFPTLDAACAALTTPPGRHGERRTPVDPDAIVLTHPVPASLD